MSDSDDDLLNSIFASKQAQEAAPSAAADLVVTPHAPMAAQNDDEDLLADLKLLVDVLAGFHRRHHSIRTCGISRSD